MTTLPAAKKLSLVLACASCLALIGAASAQDTSPQSSTPQQRPDARYPNPSGQDSNPSTTTVKPTKPAQSAKTPQNSSKGEAEKDTYNIGRKRDAAGGCSTPTDAASAHSSPSDKPRAGDQDKTVCTTTGENSQSAKKPEPSTSTPRKPN